MRDAAGDSGRSDAMKSDAGKAATASKPGDEAAAGEKLDRDEKNAMSHQVPRPEDTTQSVFNLPHSEGTEGKRWALSPPLRAQSVANAVRRGPQVVFRRCGRAERQE